MKLYDESTVLHFNAYRKTNDDMGLLECFTVQRQGEFHVAMFEILRNGSERHSMIHLQDMTIESTPICGTNTEPGAHGISDSYTWRCKGHKFATQKHTCTLPFMCSYVHV